MTTTTVAVGECCPTCKRRVPKKRTTATTEMAPRFPEVTAAAGAEVLLADHLERRARRPVKSRRGRYEHPDDYALRRAEPELVRFLREACAGGRVVRFYAASTPGSVLIHLAGPRGVFDPIAPVMRSADELVAIAPRIADGTAWLALETKAVAA
jgi:hypothetical protein